MFDQPSVSANNANVPSLARVALWKKVISWSGISIFISLAALIYPIITAPTHKLAWTVDSVSQIVDSRAAHDNRLQIQYDAKPINDATLVILSLSNIGNQPIERQNFDTLKKFGTPGLEAFFDSGSKVLSAKFDIGSPSERPDLDAPKTFGSSVIIPPFSLNAGERLAIECLVTAHPKTVLFKGHLTGVEFGEIEKFIQPTYYANWVSAGCFIIGLILWLLFSTSILIRKKLPSKFLIAAMAVLFISGILGSYTTYYLIERDMHGKRHSRDLNTDEQLKKIIDTTFP